MERWATADLHFGHRNIIKYENRPFADVEEMNEKLIDNWNSVVKPNDEIFVLGDVFFCGKEKQKEIMARLKGKKILIRGNHDNATTRAYLEMGFEGVLTGRSHFQPYYFTPFDEINTAQFNFIMSHAPYLERFSPNDVEPFMVKNVHGHVHSQIEGLDQSMFKCVSVELTGYKPLNMTEIIEWVKA